MDTGPQMNSLGIDTNTPTPITSRLAAYLSRHRVVVGLVLVGFLVRVLAFRFMPGRSDTEGAEYARIAENLLAGNGYLGVVFSGAPPVFPPLFPLLIALGSLITGNVETGARLVSLLMGTSLIVSGYLLALQLYERPAARVAAALIALHPLLVAFSTTAYVEMSYLALMLPGILFCMRSLNSGAPRDFVLAGLFMGLGSLARTEPLLYVLIFGAILVGTRFAARQFQVLPDLRRFGLTVLVFAVIVAPYVIWLSAIAGKFTFELKSAPNYVTDTQMQAGKDIYDASYGIDESLKETGGYFGSTVTEALKHPPPLSARLKHIAHKLPSSVQETIRAFTKRASLGSPWLFALVVLGLFGVPWPRRQVPRQLFLLTIIGVAAVALGMIYYVAVRYFLLSFVFLLIWAAQGLIRLTAWSKETIWGERAPSSLAGQLLPAALPAFIALYMFSTSARSLDSEEDIQQHRRGFQEMEATAQWISEQRASLAPGQTRPVVAYTSHVLPFLAHASWVPLPYASEKAALTYMDQRGVDLIVVSGKVAETVPYGKGWATNGISDSRAHLLHVVDSPDGKVSIYGWKSAKN
jgi:4-amino-4-deoxy-L-arabinose transferase-like glycosyltransferase